jgi:hypothetical protein
MDNNNSSDYKIMTEVNAAVLDMQKLESDIMEERKKMDEFRYPLDDDSHYYVLEAILLSDRFSLRTPSGSGGSIPDRGAASTKGSDEDITKHVGYMKIKFQSKKEAAYYYDKCNPHMLPLNAYMENKSQFDPNTKLSYIIRSKNHLGY